MNDTAMTFSKIDRRDISPITIAIDWEDDRQIYLSAKDLAPTLEMNVEDVIELARDGSFTNDSSTFLKVQSVLSMLEKLDTTLCKRVHYWISADIIPSIKSLPFGTLLKL